MATVADGTSRMASLAKGWDGYDADPPTPAAIGRAKAYIDALAGRAILPSRVAPSVVGGVGVTARRFGRRVYAELRNDGKIGMLMARRDDAESRVECWGPGSESTAADLAD